MSQSALATSPASVTARLVEDLHGVVVQGFASLNDKVDSGLASVNDRIDKVDSRLSHKIDKIDSGLASLNDRFDKVDAELGRVKDALVEHGRQLKDIRAALDRKVDRDELEARH